MRKISALFLSILLCFILLAITACSQADAAGRERWEYAMLTYSRSSGWIASPGGLITGSPNSFVEVGNQLGEQSWELVTVMAADREATVFFFKRKIQ